MGRRSKPVIAINKETKERRVFDCVFECANAFGVSNAAVLVAVARGTSVRGWSLFDSPENIRIRIQELEEQIKMLEEEAN